MNIIILLFVLEYVPLVSYVQWCAVVSVSPILDLFILETSLLLPNLFGCLIKTIKNHEFQMFQVGIF